MTPDPNEPAAPEPQDKKQSQTREEGERAQEEAARDREEQGGYQ